jgi:PKD repeat protein
MNNPGISIKLITLALIAMIGLSTCSKDETPSPDAQFSVSTTSTGLGSAITFTNKSSHASNFLWKFGDGNGSVTKNPTYAYDSIGDFTVTLIALGTGGVDSTTINISVGSNNITILDGEGISDMDLNATWQQVNNKFGSSDTLYYQNYYEEYKDYDHIVYYYNLGVVFIFYSESEVLLTSDYAYDIALVYPYEGTTKKGIALGNPASFISSYYGTAEKKNIGDEYDSYIYYTSGIVFYAESSGISEIDVFTPYSPTSGMAMKAARQKDVVRRSIAETFKNRLKRK